MSHFASSDEFEGVSSDGRQTREQLQVFADATAGLPGPRSLANSAAVLGWPGSHGDWVRPGGALSGLSVRSEERRVGKWVSVRVNLVGRSIIKKKQNQLCSL